MHGNFDLRSGAVEVDAAAARDVVVVMVTAAVGRADASLATDKLRRRYAMFE